MSESDGLNEIHNDDRSDGIHEILTGDKFDILSAPADLYKLADLIDDEDELVISPEDYDLAMNPLKCELTRLMTAAMSGDEAGVLTLSSPENINNLSPTGNHTAISLAAREGHEFIVRFLNAVGADKEIGILVPLAAAAIEGRIQIMAYLINNGALVNSLCMNGDTPLSLACEWGQLNSVLYLISMDAEIDPPNVRGFTPLMKACRAGHLQIVDVLISFGANTNATCFDNRHTPLSLASRNGHIHVVRILLASGANVHHRLKNNWSALKEAIQFRQSDVVAVLMDTYKRN